MDAAAWRLFFSVFAIIFVAELPDKTSFAVLLLSAGQRGRAVFAGAALAFAVQTIIAVCFGRLFGLLPLAVVHYGSGLLFLGMALWMALRKPDVEGLPEKLPKPFWSVAWMAFVTIFIAEWSDLTQLATMALVARHHQPLLVGISALLALWCVTALAVVLGKQLARWVKPRMLQKISALVLAFVGLGILLKA